MGVKPVGLIAVAAGALAVLKALQWGCGYAVEVDLGLGFFFPLVYLIVAMIPALVAIVAIVRAARSIGSKTNQAAIPLLALLILGAQWVMPSAEMAGFKARMSQFSSEEFQALADAMIKASDPLRRGDLLSDRALARSLASAHSILRVSDWPPKGYVGSQSVQIRWGGGLTGAFAVDVWKGRTEPPVSADAIDPMPLYSNVRLSWIF